MQGPKWSHGRPTTTIGADVAGIFSQLGNAPITPVVRQKPRTRQTGAKNFSTIAASRNVRLIKTKNSIEASRGALKGRQGTPAPLGDRLPPLETEVPAEMVAFKLNLDQIGSS